MSFGPFLAILQCITSKKLQKIYEKWTFEKNPISPKKRKMADFFSAKGHKFHKNGQKFKIFLFHNVLCSQWHRKKFLWSLEPYSRNELQIPEKDSVSPKIQVRLESLPNVLIFHDFERFWAILEEKMAYPTNFRRIKNCSENHRRGPRIAPESRKTMF